MSGDFVKELLSYGQKLLINDANVKDAIEFFEKAVRVNPYDAKARFFLGRAYQLFKNFKGAIEEYREAIRIDPSCEARFALSELLTAMVEIDVLSEGLGSKEQMLRQAIELYPQNTTAVNLLLEHLRRVNPEQALREAEEYLQQHTRDENALLNVAKCWAERKDHYGAVHYCLRALEVNPRSSAAHTWAGHGMWELGNRQEALKHYSLAAAYRPSVSVHFFVGRKYEEEGRFRDALHHYEEAVKLTFAPGTTSRDQELVFRIKEHLDALLARLNTAPSSAPSAAATATEAAATATGSSAASSQSPAPSSSSLKAEESSSGATQIQEMD